MSDEIQNRRGLNKPFDESEMWYVLHTLASCTAQFHQQNTKLGDIQPVNIFINDDGHIKLVNIYSWPNAENNYEASLITNQKTYLGTSSFT